MIDDLDQHRLYANRVRRALAFEQLEVEPGVELRHEHVRRQRLHDLERNALTTDVEQRNRVDIDVPGGQPDRALPRRAALHIPRWVSIAPFGGLSCPT